MAGLACRDLLRSGELDLVLSTMRTFRQENLATLRLAFPMLIGHLAAHVLHLTDLAMVGRVGVVQVSAATVAANVFNFFWLFGIGPVTAVSILVGEAHGAGDEERAREIFRGGLFSAAGISLVITLLLVLVVGGTSWWQFGQPEEVVAEAATYLQLLALTTGPLLVFNAFKGYGEARGRPWLPLWFMIASILLNVFLNWLLIYGNLGFPRMELLGAGVATLLARLAAVLALWWWMARSRTMRLRWRWAEFWKPAWQKIGENLRLGLPIGTQIVFEVSAFILATFMMGWLPNGTVAIAAHSIAQGFSSIAYTVPLSLMVAVSIRVGQARGAGMLDTAARIGWHAIAMGALVMASIGLVFVLFRDWLPLLIIDDSAGERAPAVRSLAAFLLIFAAAYAVFDGVQVVANGALRGFRDVRFTTIVAFLIFWGVCLPVGFLCAFRLDGSDELPGLLNGLATLIPRGAGLGPAGVWLGLLIGLAAISAVFVIRLWWLSRRPAQP